MRGDQNGEFAQLGELSGSRSGFQWLGVSLTANEHVGGQNVVSLNCLGHKFNVDVGALIKLLTYAPHNTSRLLCTAGARESGAERRKLFNLRSVSISVGKLRFKKYQSGI